MITAGEGNFWISLIVMVVWVVSALLEAKRKKQIQRQKEERARMPAPPPIAQSRPAPKPIEISAEDPRSIQEILEDVLWKEHHQQEQSEHEGTAYEHEQIVYEKEGTRSEHLRRNVEIEQDLNELSPQRAEHAFSAGEHVANGGQRSSKLLSPEQLAQIRAEEILKLNREALRPVGHASMQTKLPSQIFPKGIPQVIIAAEILKKPVAIRGRHVR